MNNNNIELFDTQPNSRDIIPGELGYSNLMDRLVEVDVTFARFYNFGTDTVENMISKAIEYEGVEITSISILTQADGNLNSTSIPVRQWGKIKLLHTDDVTLIGISVNRLSLALIDA